MKNILLIFTVVLLFSCQKEDSLTIGEINANKISDYVKTHDLNSVTLQSWEIRDYYGVQSYWNTLYTAEPFKIESPFIVVNSNYYSLERLYNFSYSQNTLILYLK